MKYDSIVIGARVAGSATALLLARKGQKVLLVDKTAFPSDTVSTHYIHPAGIARLKRWGLLERLEATNCPAVQRVRFDFGPFSFEGSPPAAEGAVSEAYAPRRTVLDKLLVDAAVEAGCELRENYGVEGLLSENGHVTGIRQKSSTEHADVVIGADGAHSLVARLVDAQRYATRPALSCIYYAYWSGIGLARTEIQVRPKQTTLAFPTNDSLTVGVVSSAISEFPRIRLDHESAYVAALPENIRRGRMESRVLGTADLSNFYRRPYGAGWALVGDAGYHKDPLTAQGITDAFRDAELLSHALTSNGARDAALAEYEERRNKETRALYDFTCLRASYEPPPASMLQLLEAISRSPEDAAQFVGLDAGTVRCEDFFDPENIRRIIGH